MGCLIKKHGEIKKNMTKIKNGQHSYLSTLAKGGVQVFHTKDEKQKNLRMFWSLYLLSTLS